MPKHSTKKMKLLKRVPAYIMPNLVVIANKSICKRSKCGSLIVASNGEVIGLGTNSQPCNIEARCFKDDLSANFKGDKTCCVHAEQRAIMDALSNRPLMVKGASLWFLRLDENNQPKPSGDPYCTICSKMALDAGISKFMLFRREGWTEYDTAEYNRLSFEFKPA